MPFPPGLKLSDINKNYLKNLKRSYSIVKKSKMIIFCMSLLHYLQYLSSMGLGFLIQRSGFFVVFVDVIV